MGALDRFRDALYEAGQPTDEIIPDGLIHRYDPPKGKRGRKPCWYVLFELPSGQCVARYGDWRIGQTWEWNSWTNGTGLPSPEAKRYQAAYAAIRKRHEQELRITQQRVAEEAKREWEKLAITGKSAYLTKKGIGAHGVRFGRNDWGAFFAVPMRAGAEWRGLQKIYEDGGKWYPTGCKAEGAYAIVGHFSQRGPIYLCEGYATAVTIYEITGEVAIVCFSSGNIIHVIEALLADRVRRERLVICADNDQWTEAGNAGENVAWEVECRFKIRTVLPSFEGYDTSGKPTDFNDLAALAGLDEVRRQLGAQSALEPHKESGFSFVRAGQITELLTEPYLIEEVLPSESIGFIYGMDQTFKSFLLIDLLLCVATGRPWHGHPTQKGIAVLIAGEGARGIDKRVMAWCIRHLGNTILPDDALFFRSTNPAAFCEGGNTSQVLAKLKEIERSHGKPAIVGIDTLRRNLGTGKESNPDDASISLDLIHESIVQPFKAVAAIVHHSGHLNQERMRGASNFERDSDWYYHVMRADEIDRKITMTCGKLKDDELPAPFDFRMAVVELRFEKRPGVPMTSLIVEDTLAEGEGTENKRQHLAAVFIEAVLRQARKQVLTLMQQAFDVPPQIMVDLKEVRAIFMELHKGQDRRRDAKYDWNRAKELAAKKYSIEFAGRDAVTFPTDRLNLSDKN